MASAIDEPAPPRLGSDSRAAGRDGLAVAIALSFGALVLAALGFYVRGWGAVPIVVRFAVGLVVFGVSPGLLLLAPFLSRRRREIDLSDMLLSIVTCSFSCNLALNVILFALGWSLTRLTHAYVYAQLGLCALWFVRRARVSAAAAPATPTAAYGDRSARAWPFLWAAAAVVVYIAYINGAPITNSEELVTLRKLAENPSVRYDNLSYRQGDPSTYLFVPLQIFIAGTSVVARADVSLTYAMFWAVTTALSIFVIARLAFVLFGRSQVAWLVCLWMVAIALFDPDSVSYGSGLVVPFPNRYGFAGGVLLPLILLLFWSVLRDPRFQLWRWALLVYVAVEMTFVHARETLLGVGMMAAAFAILAMRPRRNLRQIVRIAVVMAITGAVLMLYKRVNLALAPDLDAYVGAMTLASRKALFQLMSGHGFMDLLTIRAPRFVDVTTSGSAPMKLEFATYPMMFVVPWTYRPLARLCLPIALLILPVFALRARSVAELSLAAVLAALGLLLTSAFLNLLTSAIVGNPEILIVYNVVALFSVFVVCGAAWQAAAALARWSTQSGTLKMTFALASQDRPPKRFLGRLSAGAGMLSARAVVSSRDGSRKAGHASLSTVRVLIVLGFLLTLTALFSSGAIVASVRSLSQAASGGTLARILVWAPVLAIAYRAFRRDLPLFAPAEPAPPRTAAIATCLVGALLIPVVRHSPVWTTNPLKPPYPSYRFSGALYDDYQMLTAPSSRKLQPSRYPIEVIRFLRELPPNRTLLASDTLALMERVPHFAAILSSKGEVVSNYIVNVAYLRDYSRTGTEYAIAPFLTDDDGVRLFSRFLRESRVDAVVVDPEESGAVRQAREASSTLSSLLRPAFEKDGYVVYSVNVAPARSAAVP